MKLWVYFTKDFGGWFKKGGSGNLTGNFFS